MNTDGEDPRRLTHRPRRYTDLDWSPDGRYVSFETQGCRWLFDVLAYDRRTEKLKRFTYGGAYYGHSWGPESKRIVYAKNNVFKFQRQTPDTTNGYLHVVNVATGERRQLTFPSDYPDTDDAPLSKYGSAPGWNGPVLPREQARRSRLAPH